jgi:hypothetical protein
MIRRYIHMILLCTCLLLTAGLSAQQVAFCGESVPLERDFVNYRLMDVIKGNLRHRNFLPALKARSEMYFPMIIPILQQYNIPEDFKYLPVVESGFTNATSIVGAQGIWQLMPATAATLGLDVSNGNDERNQLIKATHAACKYLVQLYGQLHSWTLAAAAYNCGAGNISRNIRKQGSSDYYQLMLNSETAQYIYKIIAIKQLFEFPEVYIPEFGYNVFNKTAASASVFNAAAATDNRFKSIKINIGGRSEKVVSTMLAAKIQGSTSFTDGQLVHVTLLDDLQANGVYIARQTKLSGRAWLVSDRVYVDLGFGNMIVLCDTGGKKGVAPELLKAGGDVKLVKI